MQLYHNITTICSGMAVLKNSLLPFLIFVRACDEFGSGKVDIDVPEAAKYFGCTEQTIRRKIMLCRKLGYFHEYSAALKGEKGVVRVFYCSLYKILVKNNIEDAGGITKVSIKHIFNIKFLLTELAMAHKQKQSKYAAEKKARKVGKLGRRKRLEQPWDLLKTPTSDCWDGRNGVIASQRNRLIVSADFVNYGACQKSIAHEVCVSRRTVSRRFSDSYRIERGLPTIAKQQVFRVIADEHMAQYMFMENNFCRGIDGKAYFKDCRFGALEALTNLYNPDYNLLRCKSFRSRLRTAMQRHRWEQNPNIAKAKESKPSKTSPTHSFDPKWVEEMIAKKPELALLPSDEWM